MSGFREKSRLLYVTLRPYQYTNILIFYLLLHHTIFNLSRDQTVTDHMIKVDFTNTTSNSTSTTRLKNCGRKSGQKWAQSLYAYYTPPQHNTGYIDVGDRRW